MPTSYSWALAGPTPFVVTPAAFPVFSLAGGVGGVCNGVFHDQAYFLAMYDRILPDGYLAPLKANVDAGYEIYQGFGRVFERVSRAVERLECGSYIVFAEGGAKAQCKVEFYRDSTANGAVTIKVGTVVTTSRGGRDFVTLQDAVFGALDLGPVAVDAAAAAPGWEWNVTGQRITPASGIVLAGEIDTVKAFIQDPAYGDPTVKVRQIVDAAGGKAPMLDGLGVDRGVERLPNEPDPNYRFRIRSLPDTISPGAIRRAVPALLAPYGATFDFVETWDVAYQSCWDAPSPNAGTPSYQAVPPASPAFDADLFVYDDPDADSYPFRNRWLDEAEMRGAFVVVVPNIGAVEDVGMAYDDTAADPGAHATPGFTTATGRRAAAAYDVPSTATPGILQGGYDGFDLAKAAVYKQVYDALQRIKLAGVAAIVELRGE